jgi:CheY-like chemotaxis protein/two-component sensor histidine kinase
MDLREFIHRLTTPFEVRAEERSICFVKQIDPKLPRYVIGDDVRIGQVLLNLLSNSIKFTRQGGAVLLLIQGKTRTRTTVTISFNVSDTGIGIPEVKQSEIFEAFAQADGSTTREFGGTGLGLTISRQLVELMGGRLAVRSKAKTGSVFSLDIELPIASNSSEANAAIIHTVERSDVRDITVLLVEDNGINQKIARRFLEKLGYTVQIAEDGVEAVERYQRTPNTFSLILMDCQMPRMSGYEATQAIRVHEKSIATHIPIIAMTANAMEGDRQLCLDAGMDDYLTKPFNQHELLQLLEKWTNPSASKSL